MVNDGRFKKGHPFIGGSGKRFRSGRKKSPRNLTRCFNDFYDENSYELILKTIQKALEGDSDLLKYCHNRRWGKPKQSVELEGGETLGAGMLLKVFEIIDERRQQDAIERTGQEGLPEAVHEGIYEEVEAKE